MSRAEGYNFLVVSQTTVPKVAGRCAAWVRQTYTAMKPIDHPALYLRCASHRINNTGKFYQRTVAGVFNDTARCSLIFGLISS
jgi:hypothetical protein